MLKKLTTRGVNEKTKEFEERTANLPCSYECLMHCREFGGQFTIYNSGLDYVSLLDVTIFKA
ncbi:MAG: hypothetical protein MUF15_22595 [Acidobacteria bacterium]|jgi:hypothetical protein|nr:hypothetical protein [Acidobacteriota bacterium]